MDLARAPRRTARKKGSGYENVEKCEDIKNSGHVVKHGLDSISKTWTLLVKHGLY